MKGHSSKYTVLLSKFFNPAFWLCLAVLMIFHDAFRHNKSAIIASKAELWKLFLEIWSNMKQHGESVIILLFQIVEHINIYKAKNISIRTRQDTIALQYAGIAYCWCHLTRYFSLLIVNSDICRMPASTSQIWKETKSTFQNPCVTESVAI